MAIMILSNLKAIEAIESYFEQNDIPVLLGESKKKSFHFKEVYGDRIQIESLDSTSDYVYNAKDLITLEGKKFSKKKPY